MRTLACSLLLLVGACAAPEAEPECATAADCAAGQECASGSCRPIGGGEGGSGGGGGAGPIVHACDASDDCRGPFPLVPDLYWDGSTSGDPVCTIPQQSCPVGTCELPRECRPIVDGATAPGLFRCEHDDDCWSGRCLTHDGVKFCLRSCADENDCPFTRETGGAPVGFACASLVDRGLAVQACVPIEPAAPGRTLCQRDCDCDPSGACAPADGTFCRYVGKRTTRIKAVPVCEPLDDADLPTGTRCRASPDSCHGGACDVTCPLTSTQHAEFCQQQRCTQPCGRDGDCPDRFTCTDGTESERIGTWQSIGAENDDDDGRNVTYCQLPKDGCFDELDCCPAPDGQGGCLGGWGSTKRRCAVVTGGSPTVPRLLTTCVDLDPARRTPGQCCSTNDECDTALCVPARDGTPCAGGGVCSVPCEPDPAAGVGDDPTPARDRCAAADFGAELYHQGSTCQPFDYALVDGRVVTLNVCR